MDTQIRKLRKEKGLSQAQLAGALKYDSPATISMWESGNRKPPADKLPELAKILGCTIDDLFGNAVNE